MSKWNVIHGIDGPFVAQTNGEIVCGPFDCCEKYAEERARLISKAPEMLEIIKLLAEEINEYGSAMISNVYNAEQLITEIEGETND